MDLLFDRLGSHSHSYHDNCVEGEVQKIGAAAGQVEEHIAEPRTESEPTQKPAQIEAAENAENIEAAENAVNIEAAGMIFDENCGVEMTVDSGRFAGYSHCCSTHLQVAECS